MSVTVKLSQTDGIFTPSLSETNFTPVEGQPTFTNGQLCLINITDSTNSNNNKSDIPVISIDGTAIFRRYNAATGEWIGFDYIDNLSYYNIVAKRNGTTNTYYYYFAKDTELSLIPNFNEEARIRYRINDTITPQNIANKKQIVFPPSTRGSCPIIPYTYSSGNKIGFITVEASDGRLRVYNTDFGPNDTAMNTSGSDVLLFTKYNSFIELANTDIQDLETRVSILENDVAKLQTTVNEHSKVLKDLPALVSAVSSNVSKLYVAR